MPQIHVRPYSHAFGGACPTLEALLSPQDGQVWFNDFNYAAVPAAASGIAQIPGGFGGAFAFISDPATSAAPAIEATRGGVVSWPNSAHAADDASSIGTQAVLNPSVDDIYIAARAKVDALTNQFFLGLALGTLDTVFDGQGAMQPSKYIGVLTASTTTPTFTTNGDLRLIAKTGASSIYGSVQGTMVAATFVTLGLKITARQIRLWINGVDKGALTYTLDNNLYNAQIGCADKGTDDIKPEIDWLFVASTRR